MMTPVYRESPADIKRLSEYCAADVETERLVDYTLDDLSEHEHAIWCMTEEINDHGLLIDREFAGYAVTVAQIAKKELDHKINRLTRGAVTACTQVHNLREWVQSRGFMLPETDDMTDDAVSLDKNAITAFLEKGCDDQDVVDALGVRLAAAKTSVAKYQAMLNRSNPTDCRVRQYLLYHGAAPGRWAGVGIQPQNFPRNTFSDWELGASLVKRIADGNLKCRDIESDPGIDALSLLSQMLRGTIIAPRGHALGYADASQIEARGVAWAAGASTLVDLFASGGKVYEHMAHEIYGTPINQIEKDSKERFTGKTAVLGCGYGMGAPKFQNTCERQGVILPLTEAKAAVTAYRTNNPEIPALWRQIEVSAKRAVRRPRTEQGFSMSGGPEIVFYMRKDGFLLMRIPSSRCIYYYRPEIKLEQTKWGEKEVLYYWTVDSMTKKWVQAPIWGGHLTENLVQGMCRDLQADAMMEFREMDRFHPVLTVHDEVVCEIRNPAEGDDKVMQRVMNRRPWWARNFPLASDAKLDVRYGK